MNIRTEIVKINILESTSHTECRFTSLIDFCGITQKGQPSGFSQGFLFFTIDVQYCF